MSALLSDHLHEVWYVKTHTMIFDQVGTEQVKVDIKISKALMAKGTQDTARTWLKDEQDCVSMVLNLSHREGVFGVISNRITHKSAYYTSIQRYIAWVDFGW